MNIILNARTQNMLNGLINPIKDIYNEKDAQVRDESFKSMTSLLYHFDINCLYPDKIYFDDKACTKPTLVFNLKSGKKMQICFSETLTGGNGIKLAQVESTISDPKELNVKQRVLFTTIDEADKETYVHQLRFIQKNREFLEKNISYDFDIKDHLKNLAGLIREKRYFIRKSKDFKNTKYDDYNNDQAVLARMSREYRRFSLAIGFINGRSLSEMEAKSHKMYWKLRYSGYGRDVVETIKRILDNDEEATKIIEKNFVSIEIPHMSKARGTEWIWMPRELLKAQKIE